MSVLTSVVLRATIETQTPGNTISLRVTDIHSLVNKQTH